MELCDDVVTALAAPFHEDEIEFLPRAQSNGKALGLAYIDARTVMNRLDAAVGPGNWSFDFDVVSPDGKMVKGRLTVLGVTKCDAGEASTEDEILKSAVSDALKRCAVHFGVGRYLYYLPRVWAPYDAQKRRFHEQPRLDRAAVEHALRICGVGTAAPQTLRAAGAAEQAGSYHEATMPAPESAGDRAATAERKPLPEVRTRGGKSVPVNRASELVCSTDACGTALTKGQHDLSVRSFGRPLCPSCQKERARAT